MKGQAPEEMTREELVAKVRQLRSRLETLEAAKEHHVQNLTAKIRRLESECDRRTHQVMLLEHWIGDDKVARQCDEASLRKYPEEC